MRAQAGLWAVNFIGEWTNRARAGHVQSPRSISTRFPRPGSGAFARGVSRPVFVPGEEESAGSRAGFSRYIAYEHTQLVVSEFPDGIFLPCSMRKLCAGSFQ